MRINTNISAIISNNSLQKSQSRLSRSIERLSSGYKLNSSADDPAGCAISEKMQMQIRGLEQADNNTADGISVIRTAEGALEEVQTMLVRMKELTVQAANDVNSDGERQAIQDEIDQINKEIDRISADTEFNTQPLLNGNLTRRVYSNKTGVRQLECSDGFFAGDYGLTILNNATQANITFGPVNFAPGETITKDLAGTVEINGYKVDINEGDDLNTIYTKLMDASDKIGGIGRINGTGIDIITNKYGSNQSLNVKCTSKELADKLGISGAETDKGLVAQGTDLEVDFEAGRVGFADTAVVSTQGTVVTIKDVNNKSFVFDVPGDIVKNGPVKLVQEVTDVGTMSIHIGANEYQAIILDIPAVTSYTLGTEGMNVMTSVTAAQAVATVDSAIARANEVRSRLGAYENRFEHTTNNLAVSTENLTSAVSAMIDTDMAEEMTEYTSLTVLTQAATSILSQANERPSTVLQLLQR